MYRLFNRLPKGLEPMAEIFRKHVEEEGERRLPDRVRHGTPDVNRHAQRAKQAADHVLSAWPLGTGRVRLAAPSAPTPCSRASSCACPLPSALFLAAQA